MQNLTAEYKIRRHILLAMVASTSCPLPLTSEDGITLDLNLKDDIDIAWSTAEDYCSPFHETEIIDFVNDFRCSGESTDLTCNGSTRSYECEQVASKLSCGASVSWEYYSGGGKHGEPDDMPWIGSAYEVNVTEEEKMVTIRTFTAK